MKRFGLAAGERVKSRTDFENLFGSGRIIISDDKKIKAVYLLDKQAPRGNIKIAAVVSGKAGNAPWRNHIKRLIRVSYRLNKENLYDLCVLKKFDLKIIFSPYRFNQKNNRFIAVDDIMCGIKDVLVKIERSL